MGGDVLSHVRILTTPVSAEDQEARSTHRILAFKKDLLTGGVVKSLLRATSALVKWTLRGCKRLKGSPTSRKSALTTSQLTEICAAIAGPNASHDDLLFIAMLLTGFYGLIKRASVQFPTPDSYGFFLPTHKADPFQIIIARLIPSGPIPLPHFTNYLASRDKCFPFSSEPWLLANGQVPTRSWFIKRLARFCDNSIAGQSM
ncbi:hypothetical protein B0H13DRAFT_2301298 [Mycena leptocephala]|nr:hypothetical protein B0H13DRAFT_2301298 [Mycena leptocephala]